MTPSSTAVAATGRDAGVPWHYGDPFAEQRVLARYAAVVDRRHRDVLVVPGDDRLSWLHSITSQHLSGLQDGDSTQALVLSPNGHVEQHWQVTELDGVTWLDTEPGAAPDVLGYLQKMRFLRRVEPADVSDDHAVISLVGPSGAAVRAAADLPVPDAPGRAIALAGGGFVRRMPPLSDPAALAVDLLVPVGDADSLIATLVAAGAALAGLWAWEAARVDAVAPRLGAETDHRTIPHELGWIGTAVHLDKGCYRGQETVARVHNLGRPPRRLVFVHLAGESDELPAAGTPVERDGRVVGFLGTAVHHHELGPIALAVVKRSTPDDAPLVAGGHHLRIDADRTPAPTS